VFGSSASKRIRGCFILVALQFWTSISLFKGEPMIHKMTVEESLIQIERSCSVVAAALVHPDLTLATRDGAIMMLEQAVEFAVDVRGTLDANMLNMILIDAA
jgi:hypothetical protein